LSFERARTVVDALLWNGYVLYPYGAAGERSRSRWQLGVLAPPAWAESNGEATWQETDCLVAPGPGAKLDVRVRFLRVRSRHVEEIRGKHDFRRVQTLDLGETLLTSWDEVTPHELDFALTASPGERSWRIVLPAHREVERVRSAGVARARIVREQSRVELEVRVTVERVGETEGLARVRLRLENRTSGGTFAGRPEALRVALLGTHALLALSSGEFVRTAAAECASVRTWPVLVGPKDRRDLLLSSPIALPDHPEAGEPPPADRHDTGELDEALLLRALTWTDDEKRAARATDPRYARILEHIEPFRRELLAHVHGAVRSFGPPHRARPHRAR